MSEEKEAKLQSVLNKTARYGILPEWSHKTMDELLESSDITLFKAALKNPDHVIYPLLTPPKAPGYNLRKRSHDQDKTFVYRMLLGLPTLDLGIPRLPPLPPFPLPSLLPFPGGPTPKPASGSGPWAL